MNDNFNIKEYWDNQAPKFQNKVSKMYDTSSKTNQANINPFLDGNGNLINPYINYQKVLDNFDISKKAKYFIQQATGLSPSLNAYDVNTEQSKNAITDKSAPVLNTGSSIVEAAQKYIGTPYVWGGESLNEGGMDCSGFVYNALKDAGYNVGRTTAQGYRNSGTQINKSDMQPGDLVFFGNNGNATHIGIYIGNGQMIHSSGSSKNTASNPGKGVCVTNVDYRNDFIEARRY